MADPIEFETERLWVRQWRDGDREPFAAMNADYRVMEFFPALLTRAQSDVMIDIVRSAIAERGWSFWALERKDTGEFIGFTGLHIPRADLPFSPCVEIGWRLSFAHWGRGYATEAAKGAVDVGFNRLGLEEIVSFAGVGNRRSRAVMERLKMKESGTFEHPGLPEGSHLRLHGLYRLSRPDENLDR